MTSRNLAFRCYTCAAICMVLVLVALPVDLRLAARLRPDVWPGDVRKLLGFFEVFAHGLGVALIAVTVLILDPVHRSSIPGWLACAWGSGLLAQVLKLGVRRLRPIDVPGDIAGLSVWDTFQWHAGSSGLASAFRHGVYAFPSGHTATAVGLALGLSAVYPRGRWLFLVFALLAALQRVAAGAHFVSDTLAGAACGFLVSGMCFDPRLFGRWTCIGPTGGNDPAPVAAY